MATTILLDRVDMVSYITSDPMVALLKGRHIGLPLHPILLLPVASCLLPSSTIRILQQLFDLVELFAFLVGLFFQTALAVGQLVNPLFQFFYIVRHTTARL